MVIYFWHDFSLSDIHRKTCSKADVQKVNIIHQNEERTTLENDVSNFKDLPSHSVDDRYDSEFYLENFYDYEQGNSEPVLRGRMKASIGFWCEIGAPLEILNIIQEGYKIPFMGTPKQARFKNNKSAINNSQFVSQAISDLLSKGLIVQCNSVPLVINPLSVSIQLIG